VPYWIKSPDRPNFSRDQKKKLLEADDRIESGALTPLFADAMAWQ
jgi:hypothetical protein